MREKKEANMVMALRDPKEGDTINLKRENKNSEDKIPVKF